MKKSYEHVIVRKDWGSRVVMLSETVVVKDGLGVTAGEVAIQEYVWKNCDTRVLCVPEVLSLFTDGNTPAEGFLSTRTTVVERYPKQMLFLG